MSVRVKKLIGAFALIALLVVYSLAAMRLAVAYVVDQHGLVQAVYFIIAGVAWIPAAMALIRWMHRPD